MKWPRKRYMRLVISYIAIILLCYLNTYTVLLSTFKRINFIFCPRYLKSTFLGDSLSKIVFLTHLKNFEIISLRILFSPFFWYIIVVMNVITEVVSVVEFHDFEKKIVDL